MKIHQKLNVIVLAAGILLPVAVCEARADQLVTFVRGQSLVAQSVEKRGSWYFFTLEGGGQMGVPASVVARIETYEAPPAAPAAAPVMPSAPAQSAAAVPAPQPMTVPTDPPSGQTALAPGTNGRPPNSEAAANPNGTPRDENWRFQGRIPSGSRMQPGMRVGAERQGAMGGAGRLLGGVMPPGGNQGRRLPPSQDPPQ